jgi:excisionase family DNA binding protein
MFLLVKAHRAVNALPRRGGLTKDKSLYSLGVRHREQGESAPPMTRNIIDGRRDGCSNSCEAKSAVLHPSVGGDGPLAYSITDACRQLSVGRSKLYAMFNAGDLSYVKLGKRRLVERTEIQRLLSAHRMGGVDAPE